MTIDHRDDVSLSLHGEARRTSPSKTSGEQLLSIFMLITTVLAVLFEAPALTAPFQGVVAYPIQVAQQNGSLVVTQVFSGVEAGGIVPGMRVDARNRPLWRLAYPLAGSAIDVIAGKHRVAVFARRRPLPLSGALLSALDIGIALLLIGFAGILCYRRPGVLTCSFWLFATTVVNANWILVFYSQVPNDALAEIIEVGSLSVIGGWYAYPMVWFALRFPDGRLRLQARIFDRVWTVVALGALVWFVIYSTAALNSPYSFWTAPNAFWAFRLPENISSFVALAALFWVYASSTEAVRQRAVWAIVGFALALTFGMLGNFASDFFGYAFEVLSTIFPFALLYSVLRHQLLDISFVVNRALVYTALTAIIVALVGVVDWLVGKYLFETRAALAVEAGVTIAVGFVLQRIHRGLERFVDRVIFANRHAAERHIERVIAALSYAKRHRAVLEAIVNEPRVALELMSAGVFIATDSGLVLKNSYGWRVTGEPVIEPDDPLARLLLSERKIVDLGEVHWHAAMPGLAPGELQVAVPLFSRHDLLGIAFYGPHRNGSALDPEERRLLQQLCSAAAVAYEAVELTQAREELVGLRLSTARNVR